MTSESAILSRDVLCALEADLADALETVEDNADAKTTVSLTVTFETDAESGRVVATMLQKTGRAIKRTSFVRSGQLLFSFSSDGDEGRTQEP